MGTIQNALQVNVVYTCPAVMFEVIGWCEQVYVQQLQVAWYGAPIPIVVLADAGDGEKVQSPVEWS